MIKRVKGFLSRIYLRAFLISIEIAMRNLERERVWWKDDKEFLFHKQEDKAKRKKEKQIPPRLDCFSYAVSLMALWNPTRRVAF